MSEYTEQALEISLVVTVTSEVKAAAVSEILARNMVGLADDDATAMLTVTRYERVCHHDHDEVGS